MKKTKYIFLILLIFVVVVFVVMCFKKQDTYLDSDDFETREDRIEILKAEINAPSDFEDAEFELHNANGFSEDRPLVVPGPSDWDYKFAVKVDESELEKWIAGMTEIDRQEYDEKYVNDFGDDWTKEIVEKRKDKWAITGEPKIYVREGHRVVMLVFENEGIIFKRVIEI